MSPGHTNVRRGLLALLSLAVAGGFAPQPESEPQPHEPVAAGTDQDRQIDTHAARLEETLRLIDILSDTTAGGRTPGSAGLQAAADVLEDALIGLGLEPAFVQPNGSATFRQDFQAGTQVTALEARLSFSLPDGRVLSAADTLEVSPYSGNGAFAGPLVFAGYAIAAGPGSYLGFTGPDDLTDRVVLMLSHEPMDELGRSLWSDQGWSFAAPLHRKISAVARRGAKAVLVAHPPDHDPDSNGSADPVGMDRTQTARAEIPVVYINAETADAVLRAGDPERRGLERLTRIANERGIVQTLPGVQVAVQTSVGSRPIIATNVAGLIPGRGEFAHDILVLSAHYEFRDPRPIFAPHEVPPPAADDNASGVAGVVAAASMLVDRFRTSSDTDMRSVLVLFTSGGEKDSPGASVYVDRPARDLRQHVAFLSLDAIGRERDSSVQIAGTTSAQQWESLLNPLLIERHVNVTRAVPATFAQADHRAFNDAGIAYLTFSTGIQPEHGTEFDLPETLDIEGIVRFASLAADLTWLLATQPERPDFVQKGGRPREQPEDNQAPQRVRTGIIPSATNFSEGLLISRVAENSAAAKAGLRPGDRILTWNGQPVADPNAWAASLATQKPGDVVRVTVKRSGGILELDVTLEAAEDPRP